MSVPLVAYASLSASMLLVGSYVGLSKLLVAVFPIFLLAWLRFGIAAVAMLGWLRKPAGEPVLSPRERLLLFLQSFLGNFLFSICMLYGVALTSAVAAGVTMAAIPAAVALLSWGFARERIGARVWLAIACSCAGVALFALAGAREGQAAVAATASDWNPLGYALLLAAVVCEASYVVIGKRLSSTLSPRRVGALINAWGLALVTPMGVWQALRFDFTAVQPTLWLLLLFYSIAASIVTVWLWMRGLAEVPASRAGVFTVMLPIGAALVALALGETLRGAQLVAFGFALTGILLATWPSRRSLA